MKTFTACLVALALASAAHGAPKQIVIAPPPPPAAQSGIGPGLIFGFLVPGYTNSTFGSTQINQLCAALVNYTTGYPRTAIKCYLGPEGVKPYPGNAVMVSGFLQWQNFPGMTTQDTVNAGISRDAAEYYLQNNAIGGLNVTFPGIMIDCSCNPYYANLIGNPETGTIPGVPYASCTVEPTPQSETTYNQVGIDNGKVCPTGPQYIIPTKETDSPDLAGTAAGISCDRTSADLFQCTLSVDSNRPGLLKNMMAGQQFRLFTNNVQVGLSECDVAQDEENLRILSADEATYGPSVFMVDAVLGADPLEQDAITFTVPLVCDGDQFDITADFSGASLYMRGMWSPMCDSSFEFYKANNPLQEFPVASEPTIGYTCPACASSSGNNAVLFSYNGPNKGKFCSPFPMAGGVVEPIFGPFKAGIFGAPCIRIGVSNAPLSGDGGKPTMINHLALDTPVAAFFPGLSQYILPYSAVYTQKLAIDSQVKQPCSNPALLKGPFVGVYGIAGQGTCNTQSFFTNGGTKGIIGGTDNGIPLDTDSCAILTTTINGPLAPGASPPVVPSPAVSPKPIVPSPAVGPTPSPAQPNLKCAYSGVYRIRPYYAPCASKYIAWASPSNCSNTIVNLRSTADLGGKLQRAAWALKTSATGKVGVPTPIVAPKECTAKHLAAPAEPSNGLKLGGDSWKWQVVPAEGTKTCDMVNLISENRIKTTAFLSVPKLNNKQCSGKFAWAAKDGGRQRFRITKV